MSVDAHTTGRADKADLEKTKIRSKYDQNIHKKEVMGPIVDLIKIS